MKLAVIADIHGNLPALQAVARELREVVDLQHVLVGGDLCFGGLEPAQCIDFVREHSYAAILGNTDAILTEAARDPGEDADELLTWTLAQLTEDHLLYLADLPFHLRMVPEAGHDLYLVHATPWSVEEPVQPDAPEEVVRRMFDEAQARLVVYGHVHKQYRRPWDGRLLVNPGSVGFPLDGDPRPAYAVFTWDGTWHVELRRVTRGYDPEQVARRYRLAHPRGDVWADRIRTGLP